MSRRRPMTSPFRWVPILVAVAIVAIAAYQASRSPAHATQQDIASAEALKGKCLAAEPHGSASYSATPVSCSATAAAVRVAAVVLPGKRSTCPKGTLLARVEKPGVVGEPFECLLELRRR